MKFISCTFDPMKTFIFFILFLGVGLGIQAQVKSDFRFADVHLNDDRSGFSVFYPITNKKEYKGIVVFLHDRQNINPKAYGGIIEHILRQKFVVIYPHYERFLVSNSKKDTSFISKVLEQSHNELRNSQFNRSGLPYFFIGHGTGALLAQYFIEKKQELNVKGAVLVAPVHNYRKTYEVNQSKMHILVIEEENSKAYRTFMKKDEKLGALGRNVRTVLHLLQDNQRAKRTSFRSYNKRFSSGNNGLKDYFLRFDAPDEEDINFYYPIIARFLSCASEGKQCDYSEWAQSLQKSNK